MISRPKETSASDWLDRWHVNPSVNKDYDAIDGMRGIAILMVLACHFLYTNPESGPAVRFLGGMINGGGYGVTIFFTLSGFLIAHPFWKAKIRGTSSLDLSSYAARRFWKIYPPLALISVILAVICFFRYRDTAFLSTAAQWLIGWPIVAPVDGRFNPVLWSLIVEIHFYIILPLLFICVKSLRPQTALWTLFLALLIVPCAFRFWNAAHGLFVELQPYIKVRFPSLLDAFAFGVLLAGLENLKMIPKSAARLGDLGAAFVIAGLLLCGWFALHPASYFANYEGPLWPIRVGSALMLCYVADPSHPRTRLLSAPWLRWCGIISYEWYLLHQPLVYWAREIAGHTRGDILKYSLVVAIPLLASTIAAALIYRYFSLPLLKYGRGKNAR